MIERHLKMKSQEEKVGLVIKGSYMVLWEPKANLSITSIANMACILTYMLIQAVPKNPYCFDDPLKS